MQEIHEECGVFAVMGHANAAGLTYYGLHALQHRGQEAAGWLCKSIISTSTREKGWFLMFLPRRGYSICLA